jgi:hypothetical protein
MRWKVTKAVRASNLPAPARLVMLVLADVAEVGTAEIPEKFTPSLTVLANETGLARSTVASHLKDLEAAGWITRIRPATAKALARGERTRYQLSIPETSPVDELVQEEDQPSPAPGQPSPGAGPASPGAGHRNRSTSDQDQIKSDPSSPRAATEETVPLFGEPSPSTTSAKKRRTRTPTDEDPPEFVAFWTAYPRKADKGHGRAAWAKAIKRGADPNTIIAAAERYADYCARADTEPRFIAHASTWLNGERWEDQLAAASPRTNGYRPFHNPTDPSAYEGDL